MSDIFLVFSNPLIYLPLVFLVMAVGLFAFIKAGLDGDGGRH